MIMNFLTACVILGVGPFGFAETAPTFEPTTVYSPKNAPCVDGYFSSGHNGCTVCYPRDCPRNSREVQACTGSTNRLCRCDKGYHCFIKDPIDPYVSCRKDPTCSPGQGLRQGGSYTNDRLCESSDCETCKEGMFVNASDPDRPVCQECADSSTTSPPDGLTTTENSDADHTESDRPTRKKEEQRITGPVLGVVFAFVLCLVCIIPLLARHCRKNRNVDHDTAGPDPDEKSAIEKESLVNDGAGGTDSTKM